MLLRVLGGADPLTDPRFSASWDRVRSISALYAIVADEHPKRTTAGWTQIFAENLIPAMAARDLSDILNEPHLTVTGLFRRREYPSKGSGYFEMQPLRISAAPDLPCLGKQYCNFKLSGKSKI